MWRYTFKISYLVELIFYILSFIVFMFGFKLKSQTVTVTKNDSTVIQRDVKAKSNQKKVVTSPTLKKKANNKNDLIYDPKSKPKVIKQVEIKK